MKTIKESFGPYRLTITYKDHNFAQVTMENVAAKWPLIWSMGLNYEAANGALELFKSIGYFEIM